MTYRYSTSKMCLHFFLILLILILQFQTLLATDTISNKPAPEEPFERKLHQSGSFDSFLQGSSLYISYLGDYTIDTNMDYSDMNLAFGEPLNTVIQVQDDSYLRSIVMAFSLEPTLDQSRVIQFTLKDTTGNLIGPYTMTEGISEWAIDDFGNKVSGIGIDYSFNATDDILLKKGTYQLYSTETNALVRNKSTGTDGAVVVTGVNKTAWDDYKKDWLQWSFETQGLEEDDIEELMEGSDALFNSLYNNKAYKEQLIKPDPPTTQMPVIELEEKMLLEEIIFNTYNKGQGAIPGKITIVSQDGEQMIAIQTLGQVLEDVPNGLWIAQPNIELKAGTYMLVPSDPSVLSYDDSGFPEYYIRFGPPMDPPYDFTGHYALDLNVTKTSNIMGPVSGEAPSFTLTKHQFDLIDRGDYIEIISEYEGMPFSQICPITSRETNDGEAFLTFDLDLTRTPVGAAIGADIVLYLKKPPGLGARVDVAGVATYFRPETKTKGMDNNTYSVEGTAFYLNKNFSSIVTNALAAAGINSIGNLPGPEWPIQGAVGVGLPALVGIIGYAMNTLLERRKKEEEAKNDLSNDDHLSVGEKAMKDANNSLGKGLVNERETEAMVILAEALANSDEPDDDPFSIGDNETSSSSSDYSDSYETSDDFQEPDDFDEPDDYKEPEPEALPEGEDDWMKDPYAGLSEEAKAEQKAYEAALKEYKEEHPWEFLDSKNTEVQSIVVDASGRTIDIAYDPSSGEWVNTENGNYINMETYKKDVLPNLEKDKAFIEAARIKNMQPDPYMKEAMDKIKHDEYIQTKMNKYGANSEKELRDILGIKELRNVAEQKKWEERADTLNKLLYGAEIVQVGADTSIDLLANVVPGGKTVKYVYTFTKNAAGTATDDYINQADGKKDLFTSLAKGSVKGAGEYAKAHFGDLIDDSQMPGGAKMKLLGNMLFNASSEGLQNAVTGKDPYAGMAKGLKDGVIESSLNELFGFLGGSGGGDSEVEKTIIKKIVGESPNAVLGAIKGFTTNAATSATDDPTKWSTGSSMLDDFFSKKG